MHQVVDIPQAYDLTTVLISVFIAGISAYSALELARRNLLATGRARIWWSLGGALVLGFGIWSMHFVGMLALQLQIPVRYDIATTLLSLVLAVTASGLSLSLIGWSKLSLYKLSFAGLVLGLGVASMHYVGMAAMRLPAIMHHRHDLMLLSAVVAVVGVTAALDQALKAHKNRSRSAGWHRPLSVLLLGGAIAGMHYIGMASTQFVADPTAQVVEQGSIDLAGLDWQFALATLVFLAIGVGVSSPEVRYGRGIGISGKVSLFILCVILVTAASIGSFAFKKINEVLELQELEMLEDDVADAVSTISQRVSTLRRDAISLSRIPLMRRYAVAREAADPAVSDIEDELSGIFASLLETRPWYQMVRYVALPDDGNELIRVERQGDYSARIIGDKRGVISADPSAEQIAAMDVGDVYLSEPAVVSGAEGVERYRLGLQAYVSLFYRGEAVATLVIDLDLTPMFSANLSSFHSKDGRYITNARGRLFSYWDEGMPRGAHRREVALHLQDMYPGLIRVLAEMNDRDRQFVEVDVASQGSVHFYLRKVFFDPARPDRHWLVWESLRDSEIRNSTAAVLGRLINLAILLVLMGVVSALWLAGRILRPLREVTAAASRFARGGDLQVIGGGSSGEVGLLRQAFNTVVQQVSVREQSLREQEEFVRKVLDRVADGVIAIDSKGAIRSFSASAEMIFRCKAADMLGKNVSELMPEPFRSRHDGYIKQYLHGGEPRSIGRVRELTGRRADGEEFPLEVAVTELVHGEERLFIGLVRDVSERKAAEYTQRLSAQVWGATLESVMVTDAKANILAVNPAFCDTTGYQPEEVIGKNPRLLSSGRHDKTFYKAMWDTLLATGSWQGEVWDRRKDGGIYPKWMNINAITDERGEITHFVSLSSDITERKLSEERLEHLAHYDPLTDLPNRMLFQDRLHHAVSQAKRRGTYVALMFLDLDRFKAVNDSFGHQVGDMLLIQAAERLRNTLRAEDTIARLGGDEFTIILSDVKSTSDAGKVAEAVIRTLSEPYQLEGQVCVIGVSIGISIYPDDGADAASLARNADTAMYRAKAESGNTFCLYDRHMSDEVSRRLHLETRLRKAVNDYQFEVHYQPQVRPHDGQIQCLEALLRWDDDELGLVSPSEFIPLAEDIGLIHNIGQWVLSQVVGQLAAWRDAAVPRVPVAVNISARQLIQRDLAGYIGELLGRFDIAPEYLQLELTESSLMAYPEQSAALCSRIAKMGITISIDDFGTGYSSLAYLKRLDIHSLKIDRSFIRDIDTDVDDFAIVNAVVGLARNMQLMVVAEGVETEEQLDMVKLIGCDTVQGWYYCPAMNGADTTRLLQRGLHLGRQPVARRIGNR